VPYVAGRDMAWGGVAWLGKAKQGKEIKRRNK